MEFQYEFGENFVAKIRYSPLTRSPAVSLEWKDENETKYGLFLGMPDQEHAYVRRQIHHQCPECPCNDVYLAEHLAYTMEDNQISAAVNNDFNFGPGYEAAQQDRDRFKSLWNSAVETIIEDDIVPQFIRTLLTRENTHFQNS